MGLGSTDCRPALLVRSRDDLPLIDEHNQCTSVCHRGDLKDGYGRRRLGSLRVRPSRPNLCRVGLLRGTRLMVQSLCGLRLVGRGPL